MPKFSLHNICTLMTCRFWCNFGLLGATARWTPQSSGMDVQSMPAFMIGHKFDVIMLLEAILLRLYM